MQDIAQAEQIFTQLIRMLVRNPERVTSCTIPNASGQTIRICVDKADLGLVIGKRGQTARSLRILLAAISAKTQCRLILDISENPVVGPPLVELPGRIATAISRD
jgi:predicted RNA-binding protein YlqC (UPF0109 family)